MKTLTRLSLYFIICISISSFASAQDVPVKEAGTYNNGSDVWKVLVIPQGVGVERLIALAQVLHKATPNIRYHLFDDNNKIQELVQNKIHYPDSNYPFPEKWYAQHLVASIQTMAYDNSGPQWVLIDRYQTKLASLEPEPIIPKQIRPTAASRKEAAPGQVIIEYDPSKDLTTVSLKIMPVYESDASTLDLSALFAYEGHSPPKQGPVTLQFLSVANEWKFVNGAEVTLTIDGVSMPLGTLKRDSAEVAFGHALESVSMSLPYRMYMKIASANKVQGRIGDREFELTTEQISSLLDLASRMQQ